MLVLYVCCIYKRHIKVWKLLVFSRFCIGKYSVSFLLLKWRVEIRTGLLVSFIIRTLMLTCLSFTRVWMTLLHPRQESRGLGKKYISRHRDIRTLTYPLSDPLTSLSHCLTLILLPEWAMRCLRPSRRRTIPHHRLSPSRICFPTLHNIIFGINVFVSNKRPRVTSAAVLAHIDGYPTRDGFH